MKSFFISLLIISIAGYYGWKKFSSGNSVLKTQKGPYVIVYDLMGSKDGEKYVKDLKKKGIDCMFGDTKDDKVSRQLNLRMMIANIYSPEQTNITPVIEVNGWLLKDKPAIENIAELYYNNSYKDSPLSNPPNFQYYAEPYAIVYGFSSYSTSDSTEGGEFKGTSGVAYSVSPGINMDSYLKTLRDRGVNCVFKDMDTLSAEREFWIHNKMVSIDDELPKLPAVDVNGKFLADEPDMDTIVKAYKYKL